MKDTENLEKKELIRFLSRSYILMLLIVSPALIQFPLDLDLISDTIRRKSSLLSRELKVMSLKGARSSQSKLWGKRRELKGICYCRTQCNSVLSPTRDYRFFFTCVMCMYHYLRNRSFWRSSLFPLHSFLNSPL